MKVEQIKTLILTTLVLVSIVLFWNLVTFQRNYDLVNNQEYVKEVTINDIKKPIKDLVVPNKIIYRNGENSFHGIQNMEQITPFVNEIRKWTFYGFQRSVNEFVEKFEGMPGKQVLIVQFPGDVPFELLKSMYTVEVKEIPSGNFRYMFIFQEDLNDDEGIVYFATNDLRSIIKANVRQKSSAHFRNLIEIMSNNSNPYYAYKKNSGGYLFVNDKETVIPDDQYYPRLYDEKIFVDALFSNPDRVTINDEEYTDGSSLMKLQSDQQMLTFVDPTITESPDTVYNMITTSVNYINAHGGWTDQYYYSGAFVNTKKINFQLYTNNYPVFNELGLNELSLVVGKNRIHEYRRPYFRLDFIPYNPNKQEYTLPKGTDVLAEIQGDGVNLESVEDILIGYHMEKDNENAVIKFQPSWFYKIGNSWIRVNDEKLGVVENGLE
ncbi:MULTISPECIES: YycH family regulatory protein [Bacillaceae]|jgi:regulatory protein YycH of two-component signal transduction system YycFG|uniref:YycH family regulatory protein n=1 Tax=Bacillaceae TaxID=186817 RepID=UPI0020406BF2|nr:two-component system activity regulator YycH [Caldibacillus thermoamylovorans]MCM3055143.1 two-component system activity regulator YycH [Caldibacillus thermoamylovorans]